MNKGKIEKKVYTLFWVFFGLVSWGLLLKIFPVSPLLIPPPGAVFKELFSELVSGRLLEQTGFSLMLIGAGLLAGLAGGLVFSALGTLSKPTEALVDLLCGILHPLPGIAILPIIILWFGTDVFSVLFIIVHAVLWPMVVNLRAGFAALPENYRHMGRNFGLRRIRFSLYILFPSSFPFLLAGLKTAWARAWRALISAEMIFGAAGGTGGLGWYLFQKRVFMNSTGLFAGILIITAVGFLVERLLFPVLEKATIQKWGVSA